MQSVGLVSRVASWADHINGTESTLLNLVLMILSITYLNINVHLVKHM